MLGWDWEALNMPRMKRQHTFSCKVILQIVVMSYCKEWWCHTVESKVMTSFVLMMIIIFGFWKPKPGYFCLCASDYLAETPQFNSLFRMFQRFMYTNHEKILATLLTRKQINWTRNTDFTQKVSSVVYWCSLVEKQIGLLCIFVCATKVYHIYRQGSMV